MAKRYKVLIGIQNDKLNRRHEPGEVVELNEPEWDVKGLKAIGAIEEVVEKDPAPQGGTDATLPGVVTFTDAQKKIIGELGD